MIKDGVAINKNDEMYNENFDFSKIRRPEVLKKSTDILKSSDDEEDLNPNFKVADEPKNAEKVKEILDKVIFDENDP